MTNFLTPKYLMLRIKNKIKALFVPNIISISVITPAATAGGDRAPSKQTVSVFFCSKNSSGRFVGALGSTGLVSSGRDRMAIKRISTPSIPPPLPPPKKAKIFI